MKRLLAAAASVAVIVAFAGCTADDAPPALTHQEIEEARSDPRAAKARGIVARADSLVIPAAYFDIVVNADGQTQETSTAYRGSCEAVRCYLSGASPNDTLEFNLEELSFTDPDADERIIRFDLGERRGFNTVLVEAADELSEGVGGGGVAAGATALNYGFWAEYGFAAIVIFGGSISVEEEGETLEGEIHGALSYVAGEVTGSNPTGLGSATWRGPPRPSRLGPTKATPALRGSPSRSSHDRASMSILWSTGAGSVLRRGAASRSPAAATRPASTGASG